MFNDESHELHEQNKPASLSSEVEEWGRQFVKFLEFEYAELASELPTDATANDYRRLMMIAVVKVIGESGANPEEIAYLLKEGSSRLFPVRGDIAWTTENNARRLSLVDKKLQQTITREETIELMQLTRQLRVSCDQEEMTPLAGAKRLHRRLLDMGNSEGKLN